MKYNLVFYMLVLFTMICGVLSALGGFYGETVMGECYDQNNNRIFSTECEEIKDPLWREPCTIIASFGVTGLIFWYIVLSRSGK